MRQILVRFVDHSVHSIEVSSFPANPTDLIYSQLGIHPDRQMMIVHTDKNGLTQWTRSIELEDDIREISLILLDNVHTLASEFLIHLLHMRFDKLDYLFENGLCGEHIVDYSFDPHDSRFHPVTAQELLRSVLSSNES